MVGSTIFNSSQDLRLIVMKYYPLAATSILITLLSMAATSQMLVPAYGQALLPDIKCYPILGGTIDPSQVVLTDQFGTETVDPNIAVYLCVPVLKNPQGGQAVPTAPHLKAYDIAGTIDPSQVVLTDQFGRQTLDPFPALELLVPVLKNPQGGQAVPTAPHLKAYEVPPDTIDPPQVVLTDQFGTETVDPMRVDRLLVPSLKDGAGNLQGSHWNCYTIVGTVDPQEVVLTDQFGTETVDLGTAAFLCTLSEKQVAVVGGEILPIEMTSLFIAGAFTNAYWIVPMIAGIAGAIIAITRASRR
jgi:hypothetical protein